MLIRRDGETFEVVPVAYPLRFWEDHFAGVWEEATKEVVDHLVRGGTFVDVGAWVGPVSLWAGRKGARVIAAEPDPVAHHQLVANLTANGIDFCTEQVAISDHDGMGVLRARVCWGDSMGSLTTAGDGIAVRCQTLESFLAPFDLTDLRLIKIDIEGGEAIVIPQSAPFLRRLGVPVCLSLHPEWCARNPLQHLPGWRAQLIAHDQVLLWP
jgi:FkbM family methyltransferase